MYSILIIDDEPIVKIALRSILPWEEHGFFICGTASNGLEAVPLIEKHHPDIIITDLKMPEMDGLELIRFLKEKEYPGEILVLSNYEDFDSVRSALLLGAADYLLKIKIQPDTLLACLNKTTKKMQNTADRKDSILKTDITEPITDHLLSFFQGLATYVVPALTLVALFFNGVLVAVFRNGFVQGYAKYLLFNFVLGMVPLVLLVTGLVSQPALSIASGVVSGLLLVLLLVLTRKQLFSEMQKLFHR